ncbi:MAG: NAD(P)-binding domain-containing protein [Rickettsiales bacterium]|jgi:pyrroline-5-carboxylate reductase|nr:NAD(P)-binding domain-containing protein [Rickettsiales bacterium]
MKILLIGCGNIGGALLQVCNENIVVVQPSLSKANDFKQYRFVDNINKVDFEPDVIFVAVKPQKINEIMPELLKFKNSIIVSFLAGTPISKYHEFKKVVRIMPNVAIKVGKSVNLAMSNDESLCEGIEKLLLSTGDIFWVKSEQELDYLMLISGCGPAYIYLLAELLVKESGKYLSENMAKNLVYKLFDGSIALMNDSKEYQQLKNSVVSKGGVTEAILNILQPELENTLKNAFKNGEKRTEELK